MPTEPSPPTMPSAPTMPPAPTMPAAPTMPSAPAAASPAGAPRPPLTASEKSAATITRRKDERRAESLQRISDQTADGSLVVRQMTTEQHEVATEAARQTRTRNASRVRSYRSPGTPAT